MVTTIEVVTQKIVVYPPRGKIDIFGFGPAGPPGPPGPPGSGANVAWPIVAPATPSGNITFTGSNTELRGLITPDAASWIRAWEGPPFSWYLKANSGPLTGGLKGTIILDADQTTLRSSDGLTNFAQFKASGNTMAVPLQIDGYNASGSNLVLGPTGAEGGQIQFNPYTGFTSTYYIDRVGEALRIHNGSTVHAQITGQGVGWNMGTHPVHGTAFAALWRLGTAGGGDYTLLNNGVDSYLNASGAIHLRIGNNEKVTVPSSGFMALGAGCDGIRFGYGGAVYQQDGTWIRMDKDYYNAGSIACDTYMALGRGGAFDGTWRFWCAWNGRIQGTSYCDGTVDGNYYNGRKVSGGSWGDQGYLNNPGTSAAGYGWHPGGVAGSIRMAQNSGRFHLNNVDSGWYYDAMCAAWNVASSVALKENVIDLPVARPIDVVKELRPRWFQTPTDLTEPVMVRDTEDVHSMIDTFNVVHVCETSPHCDGTAENPCQRVKDYIRGRIGFTAEEIEQVFPTISAYDADGNVTGYDLGGLVTLLVGAVKNLSDDLAELKRRVA